MKYHIFIESRQGEPIGRWLSSYDPDTHGGRGDATLSNDRRDALQFNSREEAYSCWVRVSKVKPVRADGKPNRPLTSFTISILGANETPTDRSPLS